MPRLGAEAKPPWAEVPRAVKDDVARILGARVTRATRIYGGYAPSATFRLVLRDGRRAFFKGIGHAATNDFMRKALPIEERVYRELREHIGRWAPEFYGSVKRDGWHALLLEDLGPADVPPWTAAKLRIAAASCAEFHEATRGRGLPRWVPRRRAWDQYLHGWARIAGDEQALSSLAALAGSRATDARVWLDENVPRLRAVAERGEALRAPFALLHLDTRSDNLRVGGGVRMFDWNWVCVGPPEFDVVALAESVAAEGGPPPERFVELYARSGVVRDGALDAVVSAFAAIFASSAWRPPLPGLPRVRDAQRRQLKACLAWASRRLDLPDADWISAIRD